MRVSRRWISVSALLCAILILPVVREASQGWIFPDSVSYIDMASDAVRDSPAVLLKNAYWSPAYPAILALMMAVVRPTLATELHAAYVVHWLIFLITTACFSLLLETLLEWLHGNSWPELSQDGGPLRALICFSYAFYFLSNTSHILWYLTPDMLLQGLAYLAAAFALRLFLPDSSLKHSAALGLTLGLGYLTKAAMFPVALLLVGILLLKPPKDRLGRLHAAIALACFCLTAAPLVVSLSHEKHRITFGDSGKLNYAFVIAGPRKFSGWIGQDPGYGTPAHAPRAISKSPLVLEFRAPVSGTLPIWYDPSYWWEGLRVPISVQREWNGLLRPFRLVHSMQALFLAWAAALAPLCLLNFRVRKAIGEGGTPIWILMVWPAAAILMYCLVLFSFRYTVAYIVMFCLGAAAVLLRPFLSVIRTRVLCTAALLVALVIGVRLRPTVRAAFHPDAARSLTRAEGADDADSSAIAARELARLGVRAGDEISVLGQSLDGYYARLAGVRIVAQIWEDPDEIADMNAAEVRRVLDQLKQLGVKALVSRVKPGFVNDEGWIAIPRTDVYVRLL